MTHRDLSSQEVLAGRHADKLEDEIDRLSNAVLLATSQLDAAERDIKALVETLQRSQPWLAKFVADRDGDPEDYLALRCKRVYNMTENVLRRLQKP